LRTKGFVFHSGVVLMEDVPHLWGWRYAEPFVVDGIEYVPYDRNHQVGPMLQFKDADGSEGWDGEKHKNTKASLISLKIAYDEYGDLEWNPDLRF
jgi:hypothetical protein